MPGDDGEKTEAPTPRRLSDAREQGQIPRSADLNAALGLMGGLLCLSWFGPGLVGALLKFVRQCLSASEPEEVASIDLVSVLVQMGTTTLWAIGPVLAGLFVLALISNLFQVGFLFTTQPLMPKLSKLNPLNGVGRLFSTR